MVSPRKQGWFQMLNFEAMNKGQLRAAMRDAGLVNKGLNVEGMRAALAAHYAAEQSATLAEAPTESVVDTVDLAPVIDTTGEVIVAPVVHEETPEVAPVVPVELPPVPSTAAVKPNPQRTIEKDREERNGVKRPSKGTICGYIWDWCDAVLASGQTPRAKDLRSEHAGKLDDTTMTIQFYRWRKFMGFRGRQ